MPDRTQEHDIFSPEAKALLGTLEGVARRAERTGSQRRAELIRGLISLAELGKIESNVVSLADRRPSAKPTPKDETPLKAVEPHPDPSAEMMVMTALLHAQLSVMAPKKRPVFLAAVDASFGTISGWTKVVKLTGPYPDEKVLLSLSQGRNWWGKMRPLFAKGFFRSDGRASPLPTKQQ